MSGMPTRVGRYGILRSLARGGMAELYLARSEAEAGFEKVVVLKRIHWHLADDPDAVRLFVREAKLAATLDHPNIVQVHDFGKDGDEYFFTMEYVHGVTVAQLVAAAREQGGAVPLGPALAIAIATCTGLQHAHDAVDFEGKAMRLVHRDVAPNNILVSYAGAVKLADFGIAKTSGATATQPEVVRGKAAYMSPEQCRGESLDARSDLFATGAVLFELATGTRQFGAKEQLTSMHRIVNGDVTLPSELADDFPLALESIILRALALDREDRFESAQEMRDALKAVARALEVDTSMEALAAYVHDAVGDRPYPWVDATDVATPSAEPPPTKPAAKSKTKALSGSTATRRPRPRRWPLAVAALGGAAIAIAIVGATPSAEGDPIEGQPKPRAAERTPNERASPQAERPSDKNSPPHAGGLDPRPLGTDAGPGAQAATQAGADAPVGAEAESPTKAKSAKRKRRRKPVRPPAKQDAPPEKIKLGRDELPPSLREKADRAR